MSTVTRSPNAKSVAETVRAAATALAGAPSATISFSARLPHQFDAVFHYDVTRAVEPLERTGAWERGEFPETYPSAL